MEAELKAYLDQMRADLTHDTADLKRDMADMKRDMADMKRDIADVKGDIADVKGDIADVKHGMADLNTRVGSIELKIENEVMPKIGEVAEGLAATRQQAERRLLEEVGAFGPRTVVSEAVVTDILRRIQRLEEGR